MLIDNTF